MALTPEIVTLPARTFVGLEAPFISALSPRANNLKVIPALWDKFVVRIRETQPLNPELAFGLCDRPASLQRTTADPDTALYLAAVECRPDTVPPSGMVRWVSPAGTFAKFTHRGRVEQIGATMHHIYQTWLPGSGYERANGPDIEQMDTRFDPMSDNSVLEIFIPVIARKPRP